MALSLKTVGAKLRMYAAGEHDPLFAVGNYFAAGRDYPSIEVIEAAKLHLERGLRKKAKGTPEARELGTLVRFLGTHIDRKASAEGRPSAKKKRSAKPGKRRTPLVKKSRKT